MSRRARAQAPTPPTVPYRINDPRKPPEADFDEDEDDHVSPADALRRSADGVLTEDAIDRLALHLLRLTEHQIALGKAAQTREDSVDLAMLAMARREAAWAEFWTAMRLLPAGLLALISHKWAAVIYAAGIVIGVLHWMGVTTEAMTALVHAFTGLITVTPPR